MNTSFIDSSLWKIANAAEACIEKTPSSAAIHGRRFGLSWDMVWDIIYGLRGADELCFHSLVIRPSDFDETRKYAWDSIPHGGPASAWSDKWSTRVIGINQFAVPEGGLQSQWNMASWAEHGYVVICPDVSGCTGYGLEFAQRK